MRPWIFRLPVITLAILIAAGASLVARGPTVSRSQTQKQPTSPGPDPPGTIDGAKNPELIPDQVAYRLLLLAVAEPTNATPAELARARDKIQAAELADQDTAILLDTAAQFRVRRDSFDAQAAEIRRRAPFVYLNPQSVEGRQLVQLARQRDQNLVDTIARLESTLSADGTQKLRAHVQHIKAKIKMFPFPNMPGY